MTDWAAARPVCPRMSAAQQGALQVTGGPLPGEQAMLRARKTPAQPLVATSPSYAKSLLRPDYRD
jgi:hypothetical protein